MNTQYRQEVLEGRLTPPVQSLKIASEDLFSVVDDCNFEIKTTSNKDEVKKLVLECGKTAWDKTIKVSFTKAGKIPSGEAYEIKITKSKVSILAADIAGIRYAMITLRQLSEFERSEITTSDYVLPCVSITDSPAMSFRGIHLCWFPETTVYEIEKEIRIAAYFKFNYVVLESWGVIKYLCHPDFCWDEYAVAPGEIKRLVMLGKELGIKIVPQLNIFGHASASRMVAGKHAVLDFHKEYASLYEPDGWCWCLSNPETRKFLLDLVDELFEMFDSPEYFHLGCDEAAGAKTCALCRRADYPQLLLNHLKFFSEHLRAKNCRSMIWHDMLLNARDERWKGYIVCGDEQFVSLAKTLPKDIIICDWQYGYPKIDGKDPEWVTTKYFIEAGFDTVFCPWVDPTDPQQPGRVLADTNLFGVLATTWNLTYAGHALKIFFHQAWHTWNPTSEAPRKSYVHNFNIFHHHLRQIGYDAGVSEYDETGSSRRQVVINEYCK